MILSEIDRGGGLLLRLHEDDYDINDEKDNDNNEDVNYLMILMETARGGDSISGFMKMIITILLIMMIMRIKII